MVDMTERMRRRRVAELFGYREWEDYQEWCRRACKNTSTEMWEFRLRDEALFWAPSQLESEIKRFWSQVEPFIDKMWAKKYNPERNSMHKAFHRDVRSFFALKSAMRVLKRNEEEFV